MEQALADARQWLGQATPARGLAVELEFIASGDGRSVWRRRFQARTATPGGRVTWEPLRAFLQVSESLDDRSAEIIRHEIAHWFVRGMVLDGLARPAGAVVGDYSFSPFPLWLEEGLACALEMPLTGAGRPRFHPARGRQWQDMTRRSRQAMLKRVLKARRGDVFGSGEYACAWALVYGLASTAGEDGQPSALHGLLAAGRDRVHAELPAYLSPSAMASPDGRQRRRRQREWDQKITMWYGQRLSATHGPADGDSRFLARMLAGGFGLSGAEVPPAPGL